MSQRETMYGPGEAFFAVGCPHPPRLAGLRADLAGRVAWDAAQSRLGCHGHLEERDVVALRDCHPSEAWWQVVVDALWDQARIVRTVATSRYPPTRWGRLLVGLGASDEEAWQGFQAEYQRHVASVLRARGGGKVPDPEGAASEFFSWFFEKQIHRKLRRVGDDGRVFRFRGYLARCIRTYLKEVVHDHERARSGEERALEEAYQASTIEDEVDTVLCRSWVREQLERLRRSEYSLWRAFVEDIRGTTLAVVAQRLREESGGEHGSIPTAHRERRRARAAFRDLMLRFALRNHAVTTEDAEQDYRDLVPVMARVVGEYVREFGA